MANGNLLYDSGNSNQGINMWWMHSQLFKVRTWQVWANPRKQTKQNYDAASTRGGVSIRVRTLLLCFLVLQPWKKPAAVCFINHCINDAMCSRVIESKELCINVFSDRGETNCLAHIIGRFWICGLLPHWKKQSKSEPSVFLRVGGKNFKTGEKDTKNSIMET